jgi:hypothetical protein
MPCAPAAQRQPPSSPATCLPPALLGQPQS